MSNLLSFAEPHEGFRSVCRLAASLFVPALMLATAGCSSNDLAPTDLRSAFPDHAGDIVASARGFDQSARGFTLRPEVGRWGPSTLEVFLPNARQEPIVMRLDAMGADVSVFEIDLEGDAQRDGESVRYARVGGMSHWVGVPGGVEEWLVLDAGVPDYATPVASWIVSGAAIEQRGAAVVVFDDSGSAHIRVTADAAYGPNGDALNTQLRVAGDRIDLFVQESPGPVLVDPSWVDLATMTVGRFRHASALLPSGQVIAAGGVGGMPISLQDTAESYDPAAATWTAVAPLNIERLAHTLTPLDNGTLIAHGGEDGTIFPVYFPEIWDPALNNGAGDWTLPSPGGSLCETAGYHTATKLTDGRVLFTGGIFEWSIKGNGDDGVRCSELWDPVLGDYVLPTDQFMTGRRYNHAAALLMTGDVLVSGGEDQGFQDARSEIFDVTTELWSNAAGMNEARSQHTLTRLCSGDVLATGGHGVIPSALGGGPQPIAPHNSAEVYDVTLDEWNLTTNNMSAARYAHTASLLPDCKVLVVGGYNAIGDALNSAEVYDPLTDMWTLLVNDPITGVRGEARATTLANGGILVSGGYDPLANAAVTTSMVYQSLLADGQTCTLGADCSSGFCVDGVCCDALCDSACEACTTALKGGGSDGACEPVSSGTDPDGDCADQGLATCGENGACDGTGVCGVYASGTVCNPAACDGDDVVNADTCNGDTQAPACVDNATTDCGAYTCSGAACLTTCATVADCAGAHYCETGTGSCLPQLDNGEPASAPEQCLSGFVADDVCCDALCNNGICDACTVAAGASADGTCSQIIMCSDDNSCTLDACHPVNGCISNHVLDGAACDGGVCIAGACIPDPEFQGEGLASGVGPGSGSGGAGGTSSSGAAGDALGDPRLEGGGICQAKVAGGPTDDELPLWWLLAAVPLVRRRRA